ncbi:hypothetical protein GPA19_20430 [Azoarcus indigens]|uniref:Uncharacterized protein n=1 Tax=Azoarcus indigens TaxID=29545 RepID=A0A4R6DPT5_9RHOO|nr:hypothetical protein [Azoarcus indigens]NMG67313.1 hypothetical protein [Azoarcus indigens]TDN46947.1 hypothetical protein C7389_12320 [Azoarcus indigens]
MGHAELIHKLESLSTAQRAAVLQLVDALAAEHRRRDHSGLEQAIATARGSWPQRMTAAEVDAELARMRGEWEDRDGFGERT